MSAFRRVGAAGIAAAIAVSGCGGGGSRGAAAWHDAVPLPADTFTVPLPEIGVHGGRFVIAQTSSAKTFNPIVANETSSIDVTNRMYASLVDWDNGTHADVPMLAKSWQRSADGLTYTFHLRRGIRFSDGHPITASDVMFSFEVVFDPVIHPATQDLLQAGGKRFEVEAPDSATIVVKTAAPSRVALTAISSVRIVPRHRLEAAFHRGEFASAYATSAAPESIVTSGPWRVKEFRAGEKTVLERNPYWFHVDARGSRLPYLDELVFVNVPDQATAALEFQSGEIDALDNVNNEDYRTLEDGQQKGGYTVYTLGPTLNTNFLWFNLNRARAAAGRRKAGEPYVGREKYSWFSRVEFRRAVSLAIDRDAMIRGPFYGDAVKCWSNATPGNTDWTLPDVYRDDYDPEQARRLLASLGWKDRNGDGTLEDENGRTVSFTLKTNSNNNMRVAMANMIRDDLAKVGIRAIPAPLEFNTMVTNLREDFQYDAMLLGQQTGVPPDPAMGQNFWRPSGLGHYWNVKQAEPENEAEARMLRLIDENVATLDRAAAMRSWRDLQETLNREALVIYLPVAIVKLPVRNGFGNVSPNIVPHRLLWNIERVYVKPGRART
jgi:peptide/nickel transport system substrate-binding protein